MSAAICCKLQQVIDAINMISIDLDGDLNVMFPPCFDLCEGAEVAVNNFPAFPDCFALCDGSQVAVTNFPAFPTSFEVSNFPVCQGVEPCSDETVFNVLLHPDNFTGCAEGDMGIPVSICGDLGIDPFEFPEEMVSECCLPQSIDQADRWCTPSFDLTHPAGMNSFASLTYGGNAILTTTGSDFSEAQVLAALNAADPTWELVNGSFCSDHQPQAMTIRSTRCNETGTACGFGIAVKNFLFTAGEEPECRKSLNTQGCLDAQILAGIQQIPTVLPGQSCLIPAYTKACPEDPCPPPNESIFCTPDGVKWVRVENALPICGPTGDYYAESYYDPSVPPEEFESEGVQPAICSDALVKGQECVTDECGDCWLSMTYITEVAGMAVESTTAVPCIEPDCSEQCATRGREASRELAARKAVVATLGAVKSIKLSVAQVNTGLVAITTVTPTTKPCIKAPVGETCPCPCGEDNCDICPPQVQYGTVCMAQNTVFTTISALNEVQVLQGEPVITRTLTKFKVVDCECVDDGTIVRYFNFERPSQEIFPPTEFSPEDCEDSSVRTKQYCSLTSDQEATQVTIVVGGDVQTVFYDSNGNILSDVDPNEWVPCGPDVETKCGCVKNVDGSKAYDATLVQLFDEHGALSSQYYLDENGNRIATLFRGQRFSCGCKTTETCSTTKYCYRLPDRFVCENPTIVIDGEVTELCEGGAVIPSTGDICETGGVRSQALSPTIGGDPRCGHLFNGSNTGSLPIPSSNLPTSDPSGYADELQQFGSIADPSSNPTIAAVTANSTSNAFIAVNNTFPVQTQTGTISLTSTWNVGSGIHIGAFACKEGQLSELQLQSGTPNTWNSDCESTNGTRGPVDTWGNANDGLTQTTVWTLPPNIDPNDVVFYTTVLNPVNTDNTDFLTGLQVNGQDPLGGSCTATSIEDMNALTNAGTEDEWFIENGFLCVISSGAVYGAIDCSGSEFNPTISSVVQETEVVSLSKCTIDALNSGEGGTTTVDFTDVIKALTIQTGILEEMRDCICGDCPERVTAFPVVQLASSSLVLEQVEAEKFPVGTEIEIFNEENSKIGTVVVGEGEAGLVNGVKVVKYALTDNTVPENIFASAATAKRVAVVREPAFIPSTRSLEKMLEADLVDLAATLGIETDTKALKKDTIAQIEAARKAK